jgi:hypothetical protein
MLILQGQYPQSSNSTTYVLACLGAIFRADQYQSLSPELKRKMDVVKAQREGKNDMRKKLDVSHALHSWVP